MTTRTDTKTTQRRPLSPQELSFVRQRRVARLATSHPDAVPSVVPICYDVLTPSDEPVIVSALDQKPKRVNIADLARVRNILANPEVGLVIDDYYEDWARLAFVQIRGTARIVSPHESGHSDAVSALRAKYPQYTEMALEERPLIWIEKLSGNSWRADVATLTGPTWHPPDRPTDLTALIQGRRSVRLFEDRPVPRSLITRAIAAAGWAPSPHGRQPWRFGVITQLERRAALAEAMAETWQAQLELDGQDAEIVQLRLEKSRRRLHNAPVAIVPCLYLDDLDAYPDSDRQAAETTMAIQSLGAAIQNLLLSLYADGLDAGWMCAPLFCPEVVRDTLNLAPSLIPHALLTVGYAAKDPIRRPRRPLDELIVSWD